MTLPAWTHQPIPPAVVSEYNAWRVANGLGEDSDDAMGLMARWLAHELADARHDNFARSA